MTTTEGADEGALGVRVTAHGLEAALASPNGAAAFFCLYDGDREASRAPMTRGEDGVFRAEVAGYGAGAHYGFRVAGPHEPWRGHRFDISKLLADPHAAAFDRPFKVHPSMTAFGEDSGPFAPKAIALTPPTNLMPGAKHISAEALVVYELNLRGFSRLNAAIPEAQRGTFAGLAHPASIQHLSSLGVSAVEIMPSDAFVDERHLPPLGLSNAWGYNSVVFGAPDPRLAPGGWADVRAATDALRAAHIEAILDVVFNHNGESDEFGPTISFRGLDNAAYFRLLPDDPARYINDMGCGNCLALDRPIVIAMAIAAMRRWMIWGGIDGFRFDLATALGRSENGFDPHGPFFQALAGDPILATARLIAEPWDIGPGGYRLGGFSDSFAEWNDCFRDTTRRFWRGDAGQRGDFATRLAGSRDIFARANGPSKSVNYVVAHDGFTLADLVAYSTKHNDANGEQNRDGANENLSWNHGVEGPSDDPAILEARRRDERNLLATLLTARGTPMLSMGAELGHSQGGNNNAYAQSNATSWIDWNKADAELVAFTGRLIAIRRDHPALSRDAFLTGETLEGDDLPDVEWRDAQGALTSEAWQSAEGAVLVACFASPHAQESDRVMVAFNRGRSDAALRLPPPRAGYAWKIVADTSQPSAPERGLVVADETPLAARSTLIVAEIALPRRDAGAGPPQAALIDALAGAAGIAGDWWDVAGNRTTVTPETKIALLAGLGLPAASQTQGKESLARLLDQKALRRLPSSLVLPLDRPLIAPLRRAPSAVALAVDARIECEDGRILEWRIAEDESRRMALVDGREVVESPFALPPLPIGRHRLVVDGVPCALTVSPPEAFAAKAALRKRFGVTAQLYALTRVDPSGTDQGVGDFSTLALLGEAAGRAGAAYVGVSPMHMLFTQERDRCSPYHPSDRRFLDPILIDVLDSAGLPSDALSEATIATLAPEIAAAAAAPSVDYADVWRIKRVALEARHAAFARARANRPGDPIVTDYTKFLRAGGDALWRFACFEAIAGERRGENWRNWPAPLREGDANALQAKASERADDMDFTFFAQWLAERQLARAGARARAGGLELGLYRDLAVGAAPGGGEAWARAAELTSGLNIGAPPDPFSLSGQNWNLPAPNPLPGEQEGWRGWSAIVAANMRHAGMLRIDHAMQLRRLFLIPEGANASDGAYLDYPLDDLVGHIALESQRAQCMVVGEDLGTVPEGFRERLTRANILGMRVLWFERRGAEILPPAEYPPLSTACVATHDLATLAGWWRGADIAERLGLGLLTLGDAEREIAARQAEKRALVAALISAGLLAGPPNFDAPIDDATSAAVHGLIGGSGSLLASAQVDDLVGETKATNLPGTDRERPNWRHKLRPDVTKAFASGRARAILTALARGRA